MADFNNYSPDRVSVTFKGLQIFGFQSGTFIEAEREVDGFTKHVGSLGDVARTRNLNRTGKITLTLMAVSDSNNLLQAIADLDEQFGTGVGTFQIMDHSGTMEVHATHAWIMKRPKIERAAESGAVVWVFECADMDIVAEGNIL